jgi:hypothetical protein
VEPLAQIEAPALVAPLEEHTEIIDVETGEITETPPKEKVTRTRRTKAEIEAEKMSATTAHVTDEDFPDPPGAVLEAEVEEAPHPADDTTHESVEEEVMGDLF